jgi:hypothetical protein
MKEGMNNSNLGHGKKIGNFNLQFLDMKKIFSTLKYFSLFFYVKGEENLQYKQSSELNSHLTIIHLKMRRFLLILHGQMDCVVL